MTVPLKFIKTNIKTLNAKFQLFIMKKIALLSIALMALASSCGKEQKQEEQAGAEQMTAQQMQERIADQDSLLSLMSDIQGGLDQIKSLENILTTPSGDSPNRRQQIRDDIAAIQQSIVQRQERLAQLEARLNASNSNNANLQQAIVTLKAQINDQVTQINGLREDLAKANIQIDELKLNVDTLNTQLANKSNELAATTEEKDRAVEENTQLTNELNRCYYVVGSKKELKEHKIIETGFLRKTKILPEDFEMQYFTTADMRTLNVLQLHSRKAKVLTNQPASSYTITENESGGKVLNITDPDRFWGTTNVLVVQID